jgi:2-methylcitrate dehydratase PrpD
MNSKNNTATARPERRRPMTEALTRSLGTFVSELRLAAIPTEALGVVHTGFADCVGTMIAGSVEDPPKILQKALARPACSRTRGRLDQRHGRACAGL